MISFLLLAVVVSLIGGLIFRKDARAAASGAWRSGSRQAAQEFRAGYTATRRRYTQAQMYLRRDSPGWKDPRRWAAALLKTCGWGAVAVGGTAYGGYRTVVAAKRVGLTAWKGGRDNYRAYKNAKPFEVEVVEDPNVEVVVEVVDPAQPPPEPQPTPKPDPAPDPTPETDPEPQSQQEDPDMAFTGEASGLATLRSLFEEAAASAGNDVVAIDGIQSDQLSKLADDGAILTQIAAVSETASLYAQQLQGVVDAIDELTNG
ncbi:hypothetical protein [Streptosporangium sp. NPDC001681]|uniref:hypothetical protein n=1 Tax=Streptosporangium sp. NPDC001681 TaxID=3154395 RepID=UPI00331FE99A